MISYVFTFLDELIKLSKRGFAHQICIILINLSMLVDCGQGPGDNMFHIPFGKVKQNQESGTIVLLS